MFFEADDLRSEVPQEMEPPQSVIEPEISEEEREGEENSNQSEP
jgi:hypothetical protein